VIPFQTWIVWQLRKISYRWWARYQALKAAKVGKNLYKCALCLQAYKKEPRKRTITVDHILPVKDPAKPQAFQDDLANCQCAVCTYLRRMFCTPEGLQVLCKKCHDEKTAKERGERAETRKKTRKKKEKKRV